MKHINTNFRHFFRFSIFFGLVIIIGNSARAQQYNSDNYLSKPVGMATIIVTVGLRQDILMSTFSLLPKWEFTTAAYIFNNDNDPKTDDGYSTTYYFKWMLYENAAKTGGVAFKGGTGLDPGLLNDDFGLKDAFKTYWVNAPITIPFHGYTYSWDLMPGASYTNNYGVDGDPAWAFTYSTRLAWYPCDPKAAIVGEIFGALGQAEAIPEYKIGIRWEPNQYAVFAVTYGHEFNGSKGALFEVGMMLFAPPFFSIGNRHKKN